MTREMRKHKKSEWLPCHNRIKPPVCSYAEGRCKIGVKEEMVNRLIDFRKRSFLKKALSPFITGVY